MAGLTRKPFQGILNIIRFNWHYYLIALVCVIGLLICNYFVAGYFSDLLMVIVGLIMVSTCFSLAVSFYVYDCSPLYTLNWLKLLDIHEKSRLVNIHAGFDETSVLLNQKYPKAELMVLDFYDPARHTEVSVARARKAYPAYPGTRSISTSDIPLAENSVDFIFALLSVHEIRNRNERIAFFNALQNSLKKDGQIVVVEHLRDLSNFVAYNVGFFHFYSAAEWRRTFTSAGLMISNTITMTPFISVFILSKNGTTP